MELSSITEVNREFFNLFLSKATVKAFAGENCPFIEVPKGAGTVDVLVRYYNRGGRTGVTELPEKYPCIVIQDFSPELDTRRSVSKDWIEVAKDTTTKKVEVVRWPIPLSIRYQVSVFSTVKTDNDALTDYLFRTFGAGSNNACFMFKKATVPNMGEVGIPVPYRVATTTVDREDNRFEWVIDYTVFPYVHLNPVEWHDYIEKITVNLAAKDLETVKLVEEFLIQASS